MRTLTQLRRLLVAIMVGALALPLASGGVDARAVLASFSDVRPAQRPARDALPSPEAIAARDWSLQKHPKMDADMAEIARMASGRSVGNPLDVARVRRITVVDGGLVRIVVESAGGSAIAASAVRAAGGRVEAEYRDLVQAVVAPSALDALSAAAAVKYVRAPARPHPDAVAGEGVGASGAAAWHAADSTGANVKVGVIDVGFTGYQARQAQGDLPASLTVVDLCNGAVTPAGGQHGAAVAEVVYEMAPGIQLFLLCVGTEVQLGQAKDYAKANGISILVMSLSWFNTSRGDGTGSASSPNATVADARANGILWVNSAGNRAQQHYGGVFNDSNNNAYHNFASNDDGQTILLGPGQTTCVYLRWDAWPTTDQDFDLLLTISATGVVVASSVSEQSGSQPPTESLCYQNTTGLSQAFAIFVGRFSANTTPFFDIYVTPDPDLEYQSAAGSITEPASSPNTMAVGAICWQTNRLETYSSQGPTIDGRVKPDIAGQTVVSSGTYGLFVSCPADADGVGGFNGTSAAAPHVAGAAALLKGAEPLFGAEELQAQLQSRAADLGPSGMDNQYGSGGLQLGEVQLLLPTCSPRPAVQLQTAISDGRQQVTVTVTGDNNRLLSISFGSSMNALLDLPDGRTGLTGDVTWNGSLTIIQTTFWVRRQTAGAVTVPFLVADRCGHWPTFVGAGTAVGGF